MEELEIAAGQQINLQCVVAGKRNHAVINLFSENNSRIK